MNADGIRSLFTSTRDRHHLANLADLAGVPPDELREECRLRDLAVDEHDLIGWRDAFRVALEILPPLEVETALRDVETPRLPELARPKLVSVAVPGYLLEMAREKDLERKLSGFLAEELRLLALAYSAAREAPRLAIQIAQEFDRPLAAGVPSEGGPLKDTRRTHCKRCHQAIEGSNALPYRAKGREYQRCRNCHRDRVREAKRRQRRRGEASAG